MRDSCFEQFRERLGLDGISAGQPIWRFLTLDKAKDLLRTSDLYMCQVSRLRKDDPRESRLPDVLQATIEKRALDQSVKRFCSEAHQICENQADSVYASCWFIPGLIDNEERMWRKYGWNLSGGICVASTIKRLASSLPDERFGLGMIRYIDPDINFPDAFGLNQYRSMPFLLKLADHEEDREIRLFTRYRGFQTGRRIVPVPDRFGRAGLRVRIDLELLIHKVRLSPICPEETRKAMYKEFTTKGVPDSLIDE